MWYLGVSGIVGGLLELLDYDYRLEGDKGTYLVSGVIVLYLSEEVIGSGITTGAGDVGRNSTPGLFCVYSWSWYFSFITTADCLCFWLVSLGMGLYLSRPDFSVLSFALT